MLGLLSILVLMAILFGLTAHSAHLGNHPNHPLFEQGIFFLKSLFDVLFAFYFCIFLPILPVIYGVFVFRADWRRNSFQFLTNQGVRPGSFWLSRQLVYGTGFALVWVILSLIWISYLFVVRNALTYEFFQLYAHLPLLPLLGYAVGQFVSAFIRSGLFAFVIAMIITVALTMATFGGLQTFLKIDPTGPILLCVIAMFVSSRLQAGPMINQRSRKIGSIVRFVLPLAIVFCIIFNSVENMRLSQVCKELPAKNAFIQRALSENERALLKTYAEIRPYLISLKKNEPPKDKETVEKVVALFEKAEKIPVSSGQIGNSVSSSELLPYLNLINDISKHLAPNDSRAVFLSVIDEKDRAGYDWKLVLHLLEMYQRIPITPLTFHKEYLLKQIGSPQWIHRKGHSSKLLKQYISDLEKFHEKAVSLNPVYQLSRQIDQVMDFETPLSSYSYDGIYKKYLSELDRTRFWYKILYKILQGKKLESKN